MGSIVTISLVFLLVFGNSQVALANTRQQSRQQNNTRQNSLVERESGDRQTKKKKKPLDFSDTGRPGQQTAGESRSNCLQTDANSNNLEAVIPVSNSGKTISSHPRFWVYLPHTAQNASHIEFVIQNEAREDVWRAQFKANSSSGYQSFSLPDTAPPLQVDRWYRWYVKVHCDSQFASAEYVQGWVHRVPLLSELYLELQQKSVVAHQSYSDRGIWYDAVDRLLSIYQNEPGNIALEKDWQNLIRAKGVNLESLPQIGASYKALE